LVLGNETIAQESADLVVASIPWLIQQTRANGRTRSVDLKDSGAPAFAVAKRAATSKE
jgi:hypothetical protein